MSQPAPTISDSEITLRNLFDALVRCSLERIEAERKEDDEVVSNGPGLFNCKEAAEYLGVGKSKFGRLRKRGLVTRVDQDGMLRFARTDLDEYIAKLKRRR